MTTQQKYTLDNIFQYTPQELDNFISDYTTDYYENLYDKRYMTMYYLYKNGLLDKKTENLFVGNSERFKKALKVSNNAQEVKNNLVPKIQNAFIETNDPNEVYKMQLKCELNLYVDLENTVIIRNNKIISASSRFERLDSFTDEEMLKFITNKMAKTGQRKFRIWNYYNFSKDDMKKVKMEDSDKYDWVKIIEEVRRKGNIVKIRGKGIIESINNIKYNFMPIDSLGNNPGQLDNVACEKYLLELYNE